MHWWRLRNFSPTMNHPLPPRPGQGSSQQQQVPQASTSYAPTPYPTYFTNSYGYQASAYPAQNFGPPAQGYGGLVNPYAPHINYDLPPSGPYLGYGNAASSASTSRGPGVNGTGTQGPVGCNQPGCRFRGTQKDVQTHKMDRHLIYPPGWVDKKRKREDTGEADEEKAARLAG